MNTVNIIGRLTKDIEVRHTDGGLAVTKFTVAVDRPPKDGVKQADFPMVVAFGKTAENIGKFFGKGDRIGISGHLQTGSYEKPDGTKVYTTDIMVDRFDFIEPHKADKVEENKDAYEEIENIPF